LFTDNPVASVVLTAPLLSSGSFLQTRSRILAVELEHDDAFNTAPEKDGSNGAGEPSRTRSLVPVEPKPLAGAGALSWAHGVPSRPEILSQKPDVVGLSRALRRRLWLAVGFGLLLGSILAAAAWILIPVRYTASVMFVVNAKAPSVLKAESPADFLDYKKTQKEWFKSDDVARAALLQPGISNLRMVKEAGDDPVNWLKSALSAEYLGDSELLQVTLRGESPKETATLLNAVKKAYMSQVVESEEQQKLAKQVTLRTSLAEYANTIKEKKTQFENLAERSGSRTSKVNQLQHQVLMADLQTLQSQRTDALRAYTKLQTDLAMGKAIVEQKASGMLTDSEMELRVNSDPQVTQIRSQLAALQQQRREYAQTLRRKNDPALVRLDQHIAQLDEDLQTVRQQVRVQMKDLIKSSDSMQGNYAMLKLQEPLLRGQLAELAKAIDGQMELLKKHEKSSATLDALKSEIDNLEKMSNTVNAELEGLNLELKNKQPRVQARADAEPPSKNNAIWKYVQVAFAGLLGFGLVLFGIALWEFQSRRLSTSEEMIEGLGVRVVGSLPSLRQSRVGFKRQSKEELLESVDSIRTSLIHSLNNQRGSLVLVTSAQPHEGKTTVASQLASSLARSGKRTLLVDADLRHPGAHLVLGMAMERGLAEILRGEVELDDVVRPTQAENLWFLSAGQICRSSIQALSRKRVPEVLEGLRSGFDFVIIDSSPVLSVADARLVGQHVDGAVLSVLKDVSQIPQVYEACEQLGAVGIRLLGAVVNGADPHAAYHYSSRAISTRQPKAKKVKAASQDAGNVKVKTAKSKTLKKKKRPPTTDSTPPTDGPVA
jgi:succinoglycan biosynthesis transport protein ExoP